MTRQAIALPPGIAVLERGWLSSNNVLLKGSLEEGAVLIDSGYCTHSRQTVELVQSALGPLSLQTIINTHLHSDHCGGNALLQQHFKARVAVPPGEAEAAASWDMTQLSYEATGQSCERFRVDSILEPGSALTVGNQRWDVLAAPGHDPHSVVLFAPDEAILISADALWENGFGVVFPEIEGGHAFREVRNTLDVIGRLKVKTVIPGHGNPFVDIDAALERAYRRLNTFVAAPEKHGWYAGKALTKFHLLEVQHQPLDRLLIWLSETRYFRLIHATYFRDADYSRWSLRIIEELEKAGALIIRNGIVFNS
nr:MBL fold metallo-hydrolase [uncultured Caldimonas sp.]